MSNYEYEVQEILAMYDGDSATVRVVREQTIPEVKMDFGFYDIVVIRPATVKKAIDVSVRMYGYDTPELRDSRKDWKEAAYLAKKEARLWMDTKLYGEGLHMVSYKDRTEKYGRYLGNFVGSRSGDKLKDYLIGKHLAVEYDGQNKMEIEKYHLKNIGKLKSLGLIGANKT